MAVSKSVIILSFVLATLVHVIVAQFGGFDSIGGLGFGFGGKPFGKPSFGGFGGKPSFGGFGGLGGLGGLGGKPGKPGLGLIGGFGGLGSLYRTDPTGDQNLPDYTQGTAFVYK